MAHYIKAEEVQEHGIDLNLISLRTKSHGYGAKVTRYVLTTDRSGKPVFRKKKPNDHNYVPTYYDRDELLKIVDEQRKKAEQRERHAPEIPAWLQERLEEIAAYYLAIQPGYIIRGEIFAALIADPVDGHATPYYQVRPSDNDNLHFMFDRPYSLEEMDKEAARKLAAEKGFEDINTLQVLKIRRSVALKYNTRWDWLAISKWCEEYERKHHLERSLKYRVKEEE